MDSGHPYLGRTRIGRRTRPINFKDFLDWDAVLLNNNNNKMYYHIVAFLLAQNKAVIAPGCPALCLCGMGTK